MRIKQLLPAMLSGLFLLAALSMSGAHVVPDAYTRADAIQKAIAQNKTILLIISDTNNCTGCIQLEYLTLPSTSNPTMRQFLEESFIYWSCGPQESCTEYSIYTGPGTVPLPTYFLIDPYNPSTYTVFGSGNADPIIFYNWAAAGLHVSAKPKITFPQPNQSLNSNNIVVQGASVSTNVYIRKVNYRLNSGGWVEVNVPDFQNWQVALDPQAVLPGANTFQVYAIDSNWNPGPTNQVSFLFSTNKPAATVTLGSLSQTYDGTAKSATATTTPAGLAVSFTYNGSATAPINAGNYTVVATVTDPNYQGSATDTLVIHKATAAVTLGSLTQTYDGAPKSATATTMPAGLTVDFTYNNLPTPPVAAGNYAVVGTVNNPNYQGSATDTLVIDKAAAIVSLGSLSQTYDGTAKVATATTIPLGLPVAFTYSGSANAPTNAGSYNVVANVTDPNYLGSKAETMVIEKATGTVSLGNLQQTYDGTPKTVSVTTVPSGLTVVVTYGGSANPPTDVGNYIVLGVINDQNYQGSKAETLVISEPAPAPVITSLNPNQVQPGGDPFFLTVTGNNFLSNSVIRWNGVAQQTRYNSSTSLRATIESELIVSNGIVSITVYTPGSGESAAKPFFVGEIPAAPEITSLNPNQADPGDEAFFLYVNGTNFVTNSVIRWNGTDQVTKYLSSTSLRTTIESDLIATAGTASVTVFNPGIAGGESAPETFTIGTPDLKLTVERLGNDLIMSWPESEIGSILESTPILPGTNWQAVAGSDTTNLVIVPIGPDNEFFRLKK